MERQPTTAETPDISVVICTRNRADSLQETLACLARAEKRELRCEVVVVDNGSTDHTATVAREPLPTLAVRYLYEPNPGKGHALNRALAEAPLGEIVAVLDDDMSPHPDWLTGVMAICERRPDDSFFTGSSYVIWPRENVPRWCRHPRLQGWAYSVMHVSKEGPVENGRWFSGNHFWFRSRVLADGRRFDTARPWLNTSIALTDPQFMVQLTEDGFGGFKAPDAVCGHRVQPELLQFDVLKRRAVSVGHLNAEIRLRPFKVTMKQARLFRAHPLVSRLYCLLSMLGWSLGAGASWLLPSSSLRMVLQLEATERWTTSREYLRVANQMDVYRLPLFPRKLRSPAP